SGPARARNAFLELSAGSKLHPICRRRSAKSFRFLRGRLEQGESQDAFSVINAIVNGLSVVAVNTILVVSIEVILARYGADAVGRGFDAVPVEPHRIAPNDFNNRRLMPFHIFLSDA